MDWLSKIVKLSGPKAWAAIGGVSGWVMVLIMKGDPVYAFVGVPFGAAAFALADLAVSRTGKNTDQ